MKDDLPQLVVRHTADGTIVMFNGIIIKPSSFEVVHPTERGAPTIRMVFEAELTVLTDMRQQCPSCDEKRPHRHQLDFHGGERVVFE